MAKKKNRKPRSSVFGGLAGGIFFFGLALAFIFSSYFLPVLFATLAVTALVGSLASSKPKGIYEGFQGFVFLLGLAVLAYTDWWWPGILVLLGIMAILGSLNLPSVASLLGLGFLTRNNRQPQEAEQQPYPPYEEGYQPPAPPVTYQEGGQEYQYQPPVPPSPYEQPQVQYPQEEIPPQRQ
jgi:hypothetical protein